VRRCAETWVQRINSHGRFGLHVRLDFDRNSRSNVTRCGLIRPSRVWCRMFAPRAPQIVAVPLRGHAQERGIKFCPSLHAYCSGIHDKPNESEGNTGTQLMKSISRKLHQGIVSTMAVLCTVLGISIVRSISVAYIV
jgi:hypothetical protein